MEQLIRAAKVHIDFKGWYSGSLSDRSLVRDALAREHPSMTRVQIHVAVERAYEEIWRER